MTLKFRLKCGDDRFVSGSHHIFHALDWIERNAVVSSILFAERKQFQSDIRVGQLVNKYIVKRMVSDDQIFASFENRGTPQYFCNMLLDVLVKFGSLGILFLFEIFCFRIPVGRNNSECCISIWQNTNRLKSGFSGLGFKSSRVKKKLELKRNPVPVGRQ